MEELPMEKVSKKKGKEEKPDARGKFSGRIGYVLAVAGSAVGLEISGVSLISQQSTVAVCFCWFI